MRLIVPMFFLWGVQKDRTCAVVVSCLKQEARKGGGQTTSHPPAQGARTMSKESDHLCQKKNSFAICRPNDIGGHEAAEPFSSQGHGPSGLKGNLFLILQDGTGQRNATSILCTTSKGHNPGNSSHKKGSGRSCDWLKWIIIRIPLVTCRLLWGVEAKD